MTASAVRTSPPARLDSPRRADKPVGAKVKDTQVLDVVEQLLNAAQHPDIAKVERYGPGDGPWGPSITSPGMSTRGITGVKVTHQSTATASLWLANRPGETPIPVPGVLPPPRQNRAPRLAILAVQLLDGAKPAQFKAWQLVALPDVGATDKRGISPAGVSIVTAAGEKVLLRVSATGPTVGVEPAEDPFPDYVIPEGISGALRRG